MLHCREDKWWLPFLDSRSPADDQPPIAIVPTGQMLPSACARALGLPIAVFSLSQVAMLTHGRGFSYRDFLPETIGSILGHTASIWIS